jgi:hypothetical protein
VQGFFQGIGRHTADFGHKSKSTLPYLFSEAAKASSGLSVANVVVENLQDG